MEVKEVYIKEIEIKNFRNLNNITVTCNPELNFIVGENDLGKSNFLDLLDIIFNRTSFLEEDFSDKNSKIEIRLKLGINNEEIGIFDDCIDTKSAEFIEIKISQNIEDDRFKVICNNNDDNINTSDLKCVNFIKYSSLRNPNEDFNISSNRGISKIFRFLIEKAIDKSSIKLLKEDEIKQIIDFLNNRFSKITIFKDFKLEREMEPTELLARILKIKDEKDLDIFKSGHGFQFSLILLLYIMEKIILLKENKRRQNCIFGDKNNKSFSLILGLDEPEIHLHPFMQRQLIKELQKIIKNENDGFQEILKEIFSDEESVNNIKINGQIFIVTHSPYILTSNINQIVRFSKNKENLITICGTTLNLEEWEYKQFLLQDKNVKEAFFSKSCLIVEGDTEYGIFPYILDRISKMHQNLEKFRESVLLVNAGSKNSIESLSKVFEFFKIPIVAILDNDYDLEVNLRLLNNVKKLYFTKYKDFEEELIEKFIKLKKEDLLIDFIKYFDEEGLDRNIQSSKLQKISNKYRLNLSINKDFKLAEILTEKKDIKKLWLLAWFDINKSVYLGRNLGEFLFNEKNLSWKYIPDIYFKVTLLSLEKASSNE